MFEKNIEKYLFSVREYCQAGIIQQPKHRDQTIAFYITLFAFFAGAIDRLCPSTQIFTTVAMTIIGIACYIKIVGHRVWNIQYLRALEITNGLLLLDLSITSIDDIRQYVNSHKPSYSYTFKSLFESLGNKTAIGFAAISTIPTMVGVFVIFPTLKVPLIFACLAYFLIYLLLSIFYLFRCVTSSTRKYMYLFNVPKELEEQQP